MTNVSTISHRWINKCMSLIDAYTRSPTLLLTGEVFFHSHGDFTAIVELHEGRHEYKFFVDGQWLHDPKEV